jgi:hypothetical protein
MASDASMFARSGSGYAGLGSTLAELSQENR